MIDGKALGYEIIKASTFEVGLIKNGKGVRTWWANEFNGDLPPMEHPLIQEAIQITEEWWRTMSDILNVPDYLLLLQADMYLEAQLSALLNRNGEANWTVCPECRVDDFCHSEDCSLPQVKVDQQVLTVALRKMTQAFDAFIGECIDDHGQPKQPSLQSVMRARGLLPPYCKHALRKENKHAPTGK